MKMDFFQILIDKAKAAMVVAQPIITLAEEIAPGVAVAIPSTAPIINAVEAGAASINAVAPNAVNDAMAVIKAAEDMWTQAGPELKAFGSLFGSIFHLNHLPQAVVLTPATTAATVPSKAS